VFGNTTLPRDFVYFYIGFFIGGGVVLNGTLHTGESGNSGALGSMPVRAPDGTMVQLIELASIHGLEKRLARAGLDPALPWKSPEIWPIPEEIITEWMDTAAEAIAQAIVACLAVIDFKAVVIDGWFPATVRERLTEKVQAATSRMQLAGLNAPTIQPGSLGIGARALGAAALPLTDRFLISSEAGFGNGFAQEAQR